MPVRKTESRIPAGLQATDLGQAATNGAASLIAFSPSPVAVGLENTFIVLFSDAAQAAGVSEYRWVFEVNGVAQPAQTTALGEIQFTPSAVGPLRVNVNIGGPNIAMTLEQTVVALRPELETLISADSREASAGNPEVARELINMLNPYYHTVAVEPAETDLNPFGQFVFGIVYSGVSLQRPNRRREILAALAATINGATMSDFGRTAMLEGLGICQLRVPILAMVWPTTAAPKIAFADLAEDANRRLADAQTVRGRLDGLTAEDKIDLFNLLRFPKTNISLTARVLQFLRDHYFAGTSFSDVRTGFQGTRSEAIVRHFREGPIRRG